MGMKVNVRTGDIIMRNVVHEKHLVHYCRTELKRSQRRASINGKGWVIAPNTADIYWGRKVTPSERWRRLVNLDTVSTCFWKGQLPSKLQVSDVSPRGSVIL